VQPPQQQAAVEAVRLVGGHLEPVGQGGEARALSGEQRLRRWTDESVRAALAEFWVAHGRPPAGRDLAGGHWRGPHAATLRRRYGGVAAAWRLLGPAPPSR
jgi:hypothetical protein